MLSCNRTCDSDIGKWDSVRADGERARGLIATAAGRCLGKQPERKSSSRTPRKTCNQCKNSYERNRYAKNKH